MSTYLDDEKLESVLYETSTVELYKIPPPNVIRMNNHVQEFHDINRWEFKSENLVFKGIMRVKEQEFFLGDDDDDDEDSGEDDDSSDSSDNSYKRGQVEGSAYSNFKTLEEESQDRFRLIAEFISVETQEIWATIRYYNLSPAITTIDNTSFHSVQLVKNSNVFSTFIEVDDGLKIGLGLKFPNRVESSNFQMVLNNYLKDLANYTKMIEMNRKNARTHGDSHFNGTASDDSDGEQTVLVDRLRQVQLNKPPAYTNDISTHNDVTVKEVECPDDTDDDDFGDFVG